MNYNKVILLGNLTRDPKMSYLPSQTAVVEFGLAINRQWTGKDGQAQKEVCFVDCKAFSKMAENINKYCKQGTPLMIDGRLTLDQWEKDGKKYSRLRVTVENFQFVGGKATDGTSVNETPEPIPQDDIPF